MSVVTIKTGGTTKAVAIVKKATIRYGHEPGFHGGQTVILDIGSRRWVFETGWSGDAEWLFDDIVQELIRKMKRMTDEENKRAAQSHSALTFRYTEART